MARKPVLWILSFCGDTRRGWPARAPPCAVVLRSWLRASTVVTAGVMDHEGFVDERTPHRKLRDGVAAEDIPLMRRALAEGADPNMIDDAHSAFSPLHTAAIDCRREAVAMLLSAGARVNIATIHGSRPLDLVFLFSMGHIPEREKRAIINDLISAGADVHARNNDGRSAFNRALERGYRCILLDLLRAGAEVNTVLRSEVVPATDTTPSFERTIEVPRSILGTNASAWALVDAIKKVGDFDEYARRQLNIHISMLTKCFGTGLPVDAWSHVAGFYAPRGGY